MPHPRTCSRGHAVQDANIVAGNQCRACGRIRANLTADLIRAARTVVGLSLRQWIDTFGQGAGPAIGVLQAAGIEPPKERPIPAVTGTAD